MTVTYEIAAKPTLYKGQMFRSRLEAKWAAFFDLLRWEWCYEPFDFGGWSPIFAIRAPGAETVRKIVLVEVKPIMEFDGDVARKMEDCCPSHWEDDRAYDEDDNIIPIRELVCDFELLLLGVSPKFGGGCDDNFIGWLLDRYHWCSEGWDRALFQQHYEQVGFYHMSGSWNNRISDFHYKDAITT